MVKQSLSSFLTRWLLLSLSMFVAAFLMHGWSYETTSTLFVAILLFGLLSASADLALQKKLFHRRDSHHGVIKFFINAVLLIFISKILPSFSLEKTSSAFWGSFVITFIFSLLNARSSQKEPTVASSKSSPMKEARARVLK